MTPEERAEKIGDAINADCCEENDEWMSDSTISRIAAEIRAAVEEALKEFSETMIKEHASDWFTQAGKAYDRGKAHAYEDAAKIAEEFTLESFAQKEPAELWLANKIRARAAEAG